MLTDTESIHPRHEVAPPSCPYAGTGHPAAGGVVSRQAESSSILITLLFDFPQPRAVKAAGHCGC